ncbi:MAG: ATP synthase F1 subunit delta [Sedimentisphaerales bacterium]|nr:ATP synthase F1 subunit delta [Sedimentisphaerales bacterium]
MSETTKHIVREIYSEVIFELARDGGVIEAIMEDLNCIDGVLSSEPDFAILLGTQTIKGSEKSDIIRRVFAGKVNDLTLDFISVLARRGRMNFLPAIADRYQAMMDAHQQKVLIEVTLPKAPKDEFLNRLNGGLSKAINGNVKLLVHIDPAIIGGIVIRKGDKVIDNSVRTILKNTVKTVMERSRVRIKAVGFIKPQDLN